MNGQEILKIISRPGAVHSFRVPAGVKIWDPASPPGFKNGISGPGYATYRLANDEAHLTLQKEGAAPAERVGPVPALDDMPPWGFGSRRYKLVARQRNAIMLGACAVGLLLGLVFTTGNTSDRFAYVSYSALGGLGVGWVIVQLVSAVARGRHNAAAQAS
jgi:hypothetical protein